VEQQVRSGLSQHQAFNAAIQQIGESKALKKEFCKVKTKRPIAIMVVCSLLAVVGAADVITLGAAVRMVAKLHVVPPMLSMFIVTFAPVITLGCAVGIWMMRSWSVYLFAGWVTVQDLLLFACLGVFSLSALIVQLLVIVVSFYYICRRRNALAEPRTLSNRGPATLAGNSEITEGPLSMD
jgi:hypothetical protein